MQNLASFYEHPTNLYFCGVEIPTPGPGRFRGGTLSLPVLALTRDAQWG
jgi:hypothetical protein